ncbi:MAG: hypothetical protein FJY80_01660 [Candidatus Aminicenantes bacterium]|nr:hypothetical protein [Candidatus Aminicenantes bacterium]
MNLRTDKALFVWILLAGWFGVLMGVPWTLAVLRDRPGTGWWWEAAIDLFLLIPASAAGVWLGKKVGLGAGLRELVSRTPGRWKQARLALVTGTLVGLTLGVVQLISQKAFPKDALIPEGWLYMRYGLVSALAAHLVTDLTVYVLPRLAAVITWP